MFRRALPMCVPVALACGSGGEAQTASATGGSGANIDISSGSSGSGNSAAAGAGGVPQTGTQIGSFGAVTAVTIVGYDGDAMEPFLTRDGRYLLFNDSNDATVNPDTNLHYALRQTDDSFAYQGTLTGANSTELDAVPSVDAAGNLYFVSVRDYQATTAYSSLYRAEFVDGAVSHVELLSGLSANASGAVNFDAEISSDGTTLWFVDGALTNGVMTSADLVVAEGTTGGTFARRVDSATILSVVNTGALEYAPTISVDGLELLFTRVIVTEGTALPAIYATTRVSRDDAFVEPTEVALGGGFIEAPALTADGKNLYFHRLDGERFVVYRASR